MRPLILLFLLPILLSVVSAQDFVFLPDPDPTTGVCNSIPFGSLNSEYTYIARVPASSLDPENPRITDLAFPPCGTGTWSAADVFIAIGHLPSGLTCPFAFPAPGNPGDFRDLTPLYNSATQGPLTWNVTANTWSPMGLDGGADRSGFQWNGTDDIAVFITYQSSTVTGFDGSFHRTSTIPERSYAPTYLATTSTACASEAGLKMRFTARPAGSAVCIPDNDPTSGTCALVPFGQAPAWSTAMTYVARIPASFLDADNRVIEDVGFAPCGAGTWTSGQVRIGMGHLPTNPCPFNFPVGGTLGDFADLTLLWDSAVDGPLTWTAVADTWSRLGLNGGRCGRGFRWNGIDDVGFFLTFQNATVTGWSGSCHRTTSVPERAWADVAQSAQSQFCAEPLGLKMCLVARNYERPRWQQNQLGSRLTVNGAPSPINGPIQTTLTLGEVALAQFQSVNIGLGWELCVTSPAPGVPAQGGGIELDDCQIININVAAPSLVCLFDLQFNVPFVSGAIPFALPSNVQVSAQMANLDPAQAIGLSLSALNNVTVCGQNTVAGPTTDDGVVAVALGAGGLCASDILFYGTAQSQMFVSANGRVTFGGPDPDFSPSLSEALNGNPSVGFWTDLDPAAGGTIIIQRPNPNTVRVRYNLVEYVGGPGGTASFAILFDTASGAISLTGLNGIQPNPMANPLGVAGYRQWLGLSRGSGIATDPGSVLFAPGASGYAVNASNMHYDFYDPTTMVGGLCPSLLSGTQSITFTPTLNGGYDWSSN